MEKALKSLCFIIAGIVCVVFFARVFYAESKAFELQSNPSYYDGYGEIPEYVRYAIFVDLRKCYGDAQSQKLLDDFVAKRVSFSELESQIKACKIQLKQRSSDDN